ncbi:MAG: methyltransferase domain-containing protein [Patescibacteria group bacterium]
MDSKIVQQILEKNKEDYERLANEFSASRFLNWPEVEILAEEHLRTEMRVLDLGCGNARLYPIVKKHQAQYLGIDNCKALLKIAKENYPEIDCREGEVTNLELETNSFDIIFYIAALHHLPSLELKTASLLECFRVLKPGGLLICSVWNLVNPERILEQGTQRVKNSKLYAGLGLRDFLIPWKTNDGAIIYRYYYVFTQKELMELLVAAGFKIEKIINGRNIVCVARK